MIRFSEATVEELSKRFPQMPNRKLTMVNSLEDIHEAQELLKEIRKQKDLDIKKETEMPYK